MTEEKMDVLLAVFRTRQFRLGLLGGAALLFGWTWRRKATKGKEGEEDSRKGKGEGKEEKKGGRKAKQTKEKERETKEETVGTSEDGAGSKDAENEEFMCKVADDGLSGRAADVQEVPTAGAEVHAVARHPLVLAGSEDGVKERSEILESDLADSGKRAAAGPAVSGSLRRRSPQKEVVKEVTEAEPRDVGLVEGEDVEGERKFGSSVELADLHVDGSGAEYGEDGGSSEQRDIFAVSSMSGFEDGDVRGGERDIEEVTSRTTSPSVDVVLSCAKGPGDDVAFLGVMKGNVDPAIDEQVEGVPFHSPDKTKISDGFSQQEDGGAESLFSAAGNLSKDISDNRVEYVGERADTKKICCGSADQRVDGESVTAADLLSKASPFEDTARGFNKDERGEKAVISVPELALEEAGQELHCGSEGVKDNGGDEAVQDSHAQYDEKDGQGGQQDLTVCDSAVEVGVDAGIPDTESEQNEWERDEAHRTDSVREKADQNGGHGREEDEKSEAASSENDRDLEEDFGETGFVESEEDVAGLVGSGEDFVERDGGYAEDQVNSTLEHPLNVASNLDSQHEGEPKREWTPEGSGAEKTTPYHGPEQASSDSLTSVGPAARVHPVFRSNVDGENASLSSSEEKHSEDDLDYVYQDVTAAEEKSSIQTRGQSTAEAPVQQSPERVNNGLQLDRYDQLLADPKLRPALRSQVLRAKAALLKFYEGSESGSSCGYSSSA